VVGSRGSIVPLFKKQSETGTITITDDRMTRFWLTLDQGVALVIRAIETMQGGEIFVPKIPSMTVSDLARAVAPDCAIKTIGIRPGEKLHECLITDDESRHAIEFDDLFIIEPEFPWWQREEWKGGRTLPAGFRYTSDKNDWWLTDAELRKMTE
jgi:UDP-N-acetylglucosamine 4,6-dehydratase